MGMPVRIEDDLYVSARDQAKAEHRTIAGQIENAEPFIPRN